MPFLETCRLEQRIRMLSDYDGGNWSVGELCARYGVSRQTFYGWRARRAEGEREWFADRSHAPGRIPHRTAAGVVADIVAMRGRFPHLGPRKLLAVLERKMPEVGWPAASTIGDILKREGLIAAARRRRRALGQSRAWDAVGSANDEWACDYKGWFRTRDGLRVDPLTVSDGASRFLIDVRIAPVTIAGAQPVFEAAFRHYGLPGAMRCDNGTPFGSNAAGGLTRLSAWWLRLGIEPHFITPASPQENGRHERMHRTLKAETTRPPARTADEQQARFDVFRRHYNEERPHEALGQTAPAAHYHPSLRPMPERLEEPWYDAEHQVRRVRPSGDIKWKGQILFLSEALAGQLVGIAELETGDYVARFCNLDIGLIGRNGGFRRFGPSRHNAARLDQTLSTISPVQNVNNHPG